MRLVDLEPQFMTYGERTVTVDEIGGGANPVPYQQKFMQEVGTLAEAQGIWFVCPKCFQSLGGRVGAHSIDVTFKDRGVPDDLGSHDEEGKPSRWGVNGTGYADLTITPSIFLKKSPCAWHGFVTNGDAA